MRPRALFLCTLLSLPALRHEAQAAPAPPASQDRPPPPSLDPRDDRIQRRAIRGGPLDLSRESPELRELREFEQATFPRAGMRPADEAGEGDGRGPASGPAGPAGGPVGGLGPDATPEALVGPSPRPPGPEPRPPTIPWLSSLKLLDNLGLGSTFVRFEAHVVKYLEFYKEEKRGRSIMASWLRKQGRYKSLIEEVLDRHQLPRFLLYVCMIESGYDPHDRSTAGAVGLWQFLPEGARIYGLRVDYWVDERKDPVRATEAAARYLGDLKARFGSWHLALAAFNAGYNAVLRAMQKYNTNDYWELCRHEDGLPWETLLYVPKAIATALVAENKGLFGYEDVQPEPPMAYDRVTVTTTVSLASAARAAGVPVEELERLNPELRRGRTPPLRAGESWSLRLPKGAAAKFSSNFDPNRERLESYVVRFGERLEDIARARAISTSELRRTNGVEDSIEVRAGVTLVVPPLGKGAGPLPPPPGEEVVIVAVPDKRLVVPGRKRVFYRVIPGDTISGIARFFRVSQGELARWNNLDLDATLATKMVLDLWVDRDFDTQGVALVDPARVRVVTTGSEEFFELVETLRGRKRIVYLCKGGDTLQKIGKRYGLTADDLERINRLGKHETLRPGQPLTVYVNMTEKEKADARRKLVPGGAEAESGKEKERDKVTVTAIDDGEEGDEGEVPVKAAPRGKGDKDRPEKAGDKPEKAGDKPEKAGDKPEKAGDRPEKASDKADRAGDRPVDKSADKSDKSADKSDKSAPPRERPAARPAPAPVRDRPAPLPILPSIEGEDEPDSHRD